LGIKLEKKFRSFFTGKTDGTVIETRHPEKKGIYKLLWQEKNFSEMG